MADDETRPAGAGARPGGDGWLIVAQPRLGMPGLVALIILACVLVPFSLDIYTPSVPEKPAYFHTTEALVNLTIMGFFVFYAVGLLLFGPVSDRAGRKPVLVGGIAAYIAGSALCAVAPTIGVLIGARIIQALGAGAVNAVAMALVKDCFAPARRGALLAAVQVLSVVGPVLAPLLGGIIIQFTTWRAIFWVLAALGGLCLVGALLFRESLPAAERVDGGVIRSLGGLVRVARQRRFMAVLTVAALFNVPFMAYIAVGSYIYVDFFGQTQQVYTYFFAATAGFATLGPVLHLRFGGGLSPWRFTYVLLAVGLAAGVALLAIGEASVWLFAALMVVFATVESTVRPYTTDLLLSLCQGDTGAASSLINFLTTGLGAVGMALVMLPFPTFVAGVGAITVGSMAVALPLWALACRMR
ncbi:MAG: multidrug effflux MFS transporter [Eggerthellaceae bacterium]|nr:multidrug effflux MFS transporter [Eggerthellaceae bacterium]